MYNTFIRVYRICTATNFFFDRQTDYISNWWNIHEKIIETITTSIFYFKFKENNENDMAAHAICFDFYLYCWHSVLLAKVFALAGVQYNIFNF